MDIATTIKLNDNGAIKTINLPFSFLPKDRDIATINRAIIKYARDCNCVALSYTFPYEGNSKYKFGELIKL